MAPNTTFVEQFTAPLAKYTRDWWVVFATLVTTLPWGIVSLWDAIDSSYRTRLFVAMRLALSTFFLVLAYTAGLLFTISLTVQTLESKPNTDGRHDELAAVLVLLIFNIWHVARNVRGWLQYYALTKLRPTFKRVQGNFGSSIQACENDSRVDSNLDLKAPKPSINIVGISKLLISNRLIDNDWGSETPYLSILTNLTGPEPRTAIRENWAGTMWRAWWTQDTRVVHRGRAHSRETPSFEPPDHFRCDRKNRFAKVQDLLQTGTFHSHSTILIHYLAPCYTTVALTCI